MAAIVRVKLQWQGWQGAPGLTAFHFREDADHGNFSNNAIAATQAVESFAETIKTQLPSGVTIQCATEVESLEETTGALIDVTNVTPAAAKRNDAAVGESFAAAAGAVINWRTNVVRRRRRIRGRSFLVPLKGGAFQSDGTLSAGTITALQTAANNLLNVAATPDFGVWGRPTRVLDVNGKFTGETLPDGIWASAVSASVPDMSAVLRSRRD